MMIWNWFEMKLSNDKIVHSLCHEIISILILIYSVDQGNFHFFGFLEFGIVFAIRFSCFPTTGRHDLSCFSWTKVFVFTELILTGNWPWVTSDPLIEVIPTLRTISMRVTEVWSLQLVSASFLDIVSTKHERSINIVHYGYLFAWSIMPNDTMLFSIPEASSCFV